MTKDLQFDFVVDKPNKTVTITREFAAPIGLVWDAFTKAELLDQWNAPAPYVAITKYMNFENGGKRFYCMKSPEGVERWSLQQFSSITPTTHFKMFNVFTDANENPDPHGSDWDYRFSEANGITTVKITIYNESLERMESILEGFRIGFTMTLKNLEGLLDTLSKS